MAEDASFVFSESGSWVDISLISLASLGSLGCVIKPI